MDLFVEIVCVGAGAALAAKAARVVHDTWRDASNYARATGIVYGAWSKLIPREKINDLKSARTVEEVARVCFEAGYAELPQGTALIAEYEAGVQKHLRNHFAPLFAAIEDKRFVAIVKARHDYANAGLFFQARAAGAAGATSGRKPAFSILGNIDFDSLWSKPLDACYAALPPRLAAAARAGVKRAGENPRTDSNSVTLEIQKALYAELFDSTRGNPFFERVLSHQVDLVNLKLLFKSNLLGERLLLERGYVVGGTVSLAAFRKSFGKTNREILAALRGEVVERAAKRGLGEFERTGFWASFDKACDEEFFDFLSHFARFCGAGPEIVYYYYAMKSNEAANVLKILKAKKVGAGREVMDLVLVSSLA